MVQSCQAISTLLEQEAICRCQIHDKQSRQTHLEAVKELPHDIAVRELSKEYKYGLVKATVLQRAAAKRAVLGSKLRRREMLVGKPLEGRSAARGDGTSRSLNNLNLTFLLFFIDARPRSKGPHVRLAHPHAPPPLPCYSILLLRFLPSPWPSQSTLPFPPHSLPSTPQSSDLCFTQRDIYESPRAPRVPLFRQDIYASEGLLTARYLQADCCIPPRTASSVVLTRSTAAAFWESCLMLDLQPRRRPSEPFNDEGPHWWRRAWS